MADGCTLRAQIEVLWVEGLTQRKIAAFLGVSTTLVARYLGKRYGATTGHAQPTPTTRHPGRHDFTPLGAPSRQALIALAELDGSALRIEWLRHSGLTSPVLQRVTQGLAGRYVEAHGEPLSRARTWHLTELGWREVRGERVVPDLPSQETLRAEIAEARANGKSDHSLALKCGVSTRLIRKLAGARSASKRPDCTPCVGCSKPIFAKNFQGLCRDCRQHSVPLRASLALPIEVARRIGRDFEVPDTWQWLTLTPDSPGVNWTCHHAQVDLCPALPPPPKTCENCGVQFNTPHPWQRYCTPTCRTKPPIEPKICAECGDEFTPQCRRKDQRFCTDECRVRAARQRQKSPEVAA